jgi:two-component system, chemotaxis family, chemotaxis protein CheY
MALPGFDMKILVVDDFPTMRKIIRQVLSQIGYSEVIEASDGLVAVEVLKNNPDIKFVISDWNMPNMTGVELLRAIRKDPTHSDLPFLMVTAEADKENIVEAVKNGANNYIVKPFNASTLREKIEKVFSNRR